MRTSRFDAKSFTSRMLLAAVLAVQMVIAGGALPRAQAPAWGPKTPAGRSATLLPDGRWLLIGGEGTPRLVQLRGLDGSLLTLGSSPQTPRAWHTATVLADGSVLIVGGIDEKGSVLAAPERFVPGSATFERLPGDGFAARANHTATLLTDGRVLLVGGQASGLRDDADVWDPAAERAQPLQSRLANARANHVARLEADGRVLISGGRSADQPNPADEVFDPASGLFQAMSVAPADPPALFVTSVTPANGATDVPVKVTIGLRFSRDVDVRSVSDATIALRGPGGAVLATVVAAEDGRLVFLRPAADLQPSSRYEIEIEDVTTSQSLTARARFSFTTEETTGKDDLGQDHDSWSPDINNGWRTNAGSSPWQNLPPFAAPAGATALAGQVLRLDGRPLADVTLAIDGAETRSDVSGRFLLLLPRGVSGRRQLAIEGESASRPGRRYGFFEAGLTIEAGQTNVLPYTIWMPRLDTAHTVRIPSPTTRETVVTTPFIPGLELHLPAGSVIRGEDGQIIREIGITPIPLDRPPFPLPKNVEVPIYFTIQPGGAYVYNINPSGPKGAQLVYPNYRNVASGIIANFWHYDPDVKDWYVYGSGLVKGPQVFPDAGTRIYAFTGAMFTSGWTPPGWWPPGWWWPGGDPVDVSTGLFVLDHTDLSLPDVIPLTLRRTYRPADPATRPFGIGATHDYAMFLWSAHQYTEVDLILPDGARLHYVRTSSGTGFTDAVFEHSTSPTRFFKSTITWNGHGWDLRLRDGTVYVFGEDAPLQAIRDRFGNTVEVQHANGQAGNVTRVVSPNGRWIAFTYDSSNRITQAVDNIGRTVGYQYDASGRLWKVTDAAGGVTEYTYDSSHRLLTIKDPRNIVYLTNQYDSNNRVTLQTLADSSTYQFSYTLSGSTVTQTDLTDTRGHITRTAFNSSGYPTSRTQALGLTEERTTTYTRDATSQRVTSTTDPLGRETDYTYDVTGNVTSATRLAGTTDAVTTSWTYEPTFSQVATVTDPLSHVRTFTYDSQGHLTTVTDPLSHQTTFTYNSSGQPLTMANHLSETVTLGYDQGDLVSVTNPLNETATGFVDGAGRMVRVADPLGRITRFDYDQLSRLTAATDPVGGQTTFSYDGNSNLLTLNDANSHTTTWTYDNRDRAATRTDPLTHQESFVYDAGNHLTQTTDRKSQITSRTYDALDRLTQVTFDDNSTIDFTYDAGNRLTQIADSANGTIMRSYDGLDRLTQETTALGTVSYTYDAAGRRTSMTVAGQTAVNYGYDDADRLTTVTQGTATVSFTYDAANRRTTETFPNGIVATSGYDSAGRLTSLSYALGATVIGDLTYTYDAAGRRTGVGGSWAQADLPTALGSATYDAANRIAARDATSFTFDLNGNMTGDGVNTYSWNARNQLVGVSGGSSASFLYDGAGRRRSKVVGSSTTAYLYDRLNVVQELSAGGTPTANLLTGRRIDERFIRTDAGGAMTLLGDALGSTRALADGTGTIQTAYTYEPFGRSATTGTASANSFEFTGREGDGTGLSFYRRRYYDPRLQRFISEDPLGSAGGINLFAYVGNSPVMFTDPLGLKPNPASGQPPGPGAGGDGGAGGAGGAGGDGGAGGGDGGDSGAGPIGTHAASSAVLSAADVAIEASESAGARAAGAAAGAAAEAALASEAAVNLYRIQEQHVQDINNACLQLNLSCGVPTPTSNPRR